MMHRSDRLLFPWLDDEPLEESYLPYQGILDEAYQWMHRGGLDQANDLLKQNSHLPQSPYQTVRAQFIQGRYREALDAAGTGAVQGESEDHLGAAADFYAHGADAARRIPDWALVSQLKKFESDMCYGSKPQRKRYRRACEASRQALEAWQSRRQLTDSNGTRDVHFEFRLADDLGVRALMVADDGYAVHALERAAVLLLILCDREDFDKSQYENDDLFLDWNWASLHHSMGKYELALKHALSARAKASSSSSPRNFGRINSLIAEIALDCVDAGVVWRGYGQKRLLNAAEKAIPDAIKVAKEESYIPDYIMALVAQARWLRQSKWRAERIAVLSQIQDLASPFEHDDPLLYGRVEIAWGDEYAYRNTVRSSKGSVRTARRFYKQAETRLTDVEALALARVAHKRLERLFQQANPPLRKPFTPPGEDKIQHN